MGILENWVKFTTGSTDVLYINSLTCASAQTDQSFSCPHEETLRFILYHRDEASTLCKAIDVCFRFLLYFQKTPISEYFVVAADVFMWQTVYMVLNPRLDRCFDCIRGIGLFLIKCHFYIGRVKQKSAFEHAQKGHIQIILRTRKVSSESLLSVHTFCM